jgi:hypothetical protein
MQGRRLAIGVGVSVLAVAACDVVREPEAPWLTAPSVDSHAQYFPLTGSVHDGIDCNTCHGGFTTFREFDCVTCHDARPTTPDMIHTGVVTAYQHASAACFQCHPTGAGIMADHGRFFPVGAGTKHNLACAQCHGSPRADLSKQQCAACHVANDASLATAHAKSSIGRDYTASAACGGASATTCPQSCLGCHADGRVQTVSGHPSFDGRRLPHEGATCLECHDAPLRTDLVASPVPPGTTPTPYAVNFGSDPAACSKLAAKQGCYHCHTSCPPN